MRNGGVMNKEIWKMVMDLVNKKYQDRINIKKYKEDIEDIVNLLEDMAISVEYDIDHEGRE